MEQDAVLIKELKTEKDTNQRLYLVVIDGYNVRWNLFGELANYKLNVNHGYLFKYERNGIYKNVKTIEPLQNIFEVQALKKLASIDDIKKDIGISLRFATDLAISGKIPLEDLLKKSDELYTYITNKANDLMPKEVK